MDALKSIVQPLVGGSSMLDGMKLVMLGGTVETARRVSSSAWSHFVNSFFLTAHFSEEDFPYDWLMLWLSRQPEWQRSREFETTTRTTTPGFNSTRTADNSFGDEDDLDDVKANEDDDVPGKVKTRVVFQPTFDTTHTIYYRGHWLRVRRGRKQDGSNCEMLSISVVARNNTILKQLVLQAKKEYEAEAVHRIQIYFADSHGGWRWTDSRHKRPISSIVLNPGVKEMLLNDTKDFLKSEKWYADRGIPFRRGYLLHGVPGSGKSSLIHAIAGELMLDIYTLSLSSSWISDGTLTTLMSRVPARCIVLLEDLDAAFTRSVTRDSDSTGTPGGDKSKDRDDEGMGPMAPPSSSRSRRSREANLSDVNTLSLSGLLNALDGVAASEGRILFATTNHLERLDPALSRPGRMDVWVEFRNASKWQAEALFRNFFPSTEEESATKDAEMEKELRGIELPTTPIPQSPTTSTLWSMSPSSLASSVDLSSVSPPFSPSHSPSSSNSAMPMPGPEMFGAKNRAYMPPPVEENIASLAHSAKPLDAAKLAFLAKKFADGCPDEEFSVAALQGYLLKNKSNPEAAASEVVAWVLSERELRERLAREKEMRDAKEKLEREKRRKEVVEKEREKAELEKKELELARIKLQLQEKETKDLADADRKKDAEAKAVAELTQPLTMPPPPTSPLKIDPICRETSSGSGSDDEAENIPVRLPPPAPQWLPGDFDGDTGSPI
ncbi:P-loop containing nucleoside triphosphate hydrolase protein [Athelia psychrophila]|uniref:P-loop containing nucleoside triphosphate hydrolase protein n=1 Tax=Athelia psychrophila TaxID=1759441 RepID=A0A166PUR8_9AGAM|nr:P-loop containing nucleoside triphosphate hydrolase protein [Fibularhizoctonia sp. CBS 109695]